MRSAEEVTLVNTFNGAYLAAFAAVDALLVIDSCKVILDYDSTRGTVLLAFSASDTTVFAELAHLRALVMVITGNGNASRVADKVYYRVRAFLNAHSAADALTSIDVSNTVF